MPPPRPTRTAIWRSKQRTGVRSPSRVLVKEKVTVAITGALFGAVLLTSINAQLGGIG